MTDEDDHDLTPCNQSPSLSASGGGMTWVEGHHRQTASGCYVELPHHDEMEELWKKHVHIVMQNSSNEGLLETFLSFGRLFKELKTKTSVMTQDAIVTLNKERNPFSQELVKRAADHFQHLNDILMTVSYYPYVW